MIRRVGILLVSIAAMAVGAGNVYAQPAAVPTEVTLPSGDTPFQGGLGLLLALPAGEFGTLGPDRAFGVTGHLGVGLGESIISLGGEGTWMQYGSAEWSTLFGSGVPELHGKRISVETRNAMATLHGRVRAQRRRGRWRPYTDGLFGFAIIYTESETRLDGVSIGETETQARDLVASRGFGAGVMMRSRPGDEVPMLDIGVRYLRGGRADYLVEGAIRRVDSRVIRDVTHSRTDMVTVHIGMAFGR
jgi:hypothetical protein